jgi:hypothetical protein
MHSFIFYSPDVCGVEREYEYTKKKLKFNACMQHEELFCNDRVDRTQNDYYNGSSQFNHEAHLASS